MDYTQIWLIGFMATGKSRTARPLAVALDWQSLDMDTLIEERAGESIPKIFGKGGEAAFRELERQIVEEIAERDGIVVATGGGTVLAETNRAAMRKRGFVVCLDARTETLAARIADSGRHVSDRPLLSGENPVDRIIELKNERQPLYAQADFIIQTDDMSPDQVTHQILTAFRERSAVAGGTP
jgi:shikimate kinase